jgi:hypothetical protein
MATIYNYGTGQHIAASSGAGTESDPMVQRAGTKSDVIDLTLTTDTNAYSAADVVAATQELAGAVLSLGGTAVVQSITLLDQADQTPAGYLLYFLKTNVAIGTENAAVSISDTNAIQILGVVSIAAADFVDLIGSRLACVKNIGLPIKAASDSTSVFVALVSVDATPTLAADSLRLKVGLLQD